MKRKSNLSLLSVLIAGLMLTACGGGGGETASAKPPSSGDGNSGNPVVTKSTIKGKVIDGYVSGATVWLDINADRIRNADEPSAISGQAGAYVLELTETQRECVAYATLYVDVPVGALDEDSGMVTQAYQMSRPPVLAPPTAEDVLHISPLTTVLSEQILEKLNPQGLTPKTCAELKANRQLVQSLKDELRSLFQTFVNKYNISEAQIYADFIQNNDSKSYQLAQSIVKGLKASYSYRQQLKTLYPEASYVRTLFYQGSALDLNNAYPAAWYRESSIWSGKSYFYELAKMNDDLSEVRRPIYLRETLDSSWGAGTFTATHDRASQGGDGSEYLCTAQEMVSAEDKNIRYTLNNLFEGHRVSDISTCPSATFETPVSKYYSIYYVTNGVNYSTTFTILKEDSEFSQLKEWVALKNKADVLDLQTLISRLSQSGYLFEQDVTLNTYDWHKRSTDDRTGQRIQIDRWKDGRWEKLSYKADNTFVKECSNDGLNWRVCAS